MTRFSEEKRLAHRAYMSKWRKENREHLLEYTRNYVKKNAVRIRELRRIGYAKDPSKKIAAATAYKKRNPESHVAWLRGISRERARLLRLSSCEICGKKGTKEKPLHIDHCHKSGKCRGALCRHCNFAIGFLNEDIGRLKSAIIYLKRYGKHHGP